MYRFDVTAVSCQIVFWFLVHVPRVRHEVETKPSSFDFHFRVLFFRFSPFSTYCTFVNTVLTHIKIGTSVEWNCSNNLSKY